ncbi:glycosyltransferase [Longilinea arvoryzae]|uniref:Glycosyltransferase n=1 Tax=Longilinea arvoryzae TaxID=360412 RepID=A0A0S7BHY3_9CHLR|nr:glycosyltransferase [Longilinea arvoryzae]GAP13880.1 glycosyltransferase [Longilinea arvoryzae]
MSIPVRLGLVQRVLPAYRATLFDALAKDCPDGLSVFAGQSRPEEMIESGAGLQIARRFQARNLHLPFHLCWQAGLMSWLNSWQPQVIIVEANPRYLHTPAAVGWMHARSRKVIGWGLGAPGPQTGLRGAIRRRFLSQFDALLTYSQQGAAEYRAAGFPADRIFVAPNAATPRPVNPPPVRQEIFANGHPTVLFVGRLQARKRVDVLLRACAALPASIQPAVWIVGDGPARAELETLAGQVYPAAQFFGARHGASLDPLFDAADLFVLPGTGGLALQQAMSHALPVMAAQADGTQADLVRSANGWQLIPGSLNDLTRSLQQALSDAARLRRMGLESYRIVADEINLEQMVSVFAQAVHAVLEG